MPLFRKKSSKNIVLIIVIVVCVCASSLGGYYFGNSQGVVKGKQLQSSQDKADKDEISNRLVNQAQNSIDLTDRYNQLSDKYNTLISAIAKYVSTTQYQAVTHISCSSMTYGINNQFTNTNCY